MEVIDGDGVSTGQLQPASHLKLSSGDLRSQIVSFPFDLTWIATSGNAFDAGVLRRIAPVPEADYRILADFYLSHLSPLFGHVIALDTIGACYRVHGANSFASADASLDLNHIRKMIKYTDITYRYIEHFANQLNLAHDPYPLRQRLSVSSIGERIISLKLARSEHPVPGDTLFGLLNLGVRAAFGRFDVSLPLQVLYCSWFAIMAVAPRRQSKWLAEKFYFPEKRLLLNRILRFFHPVTEARNSNFRYAASIDVCSKSNMKRQAASMSAYNADK